jgi:hypothetical protein
MRVVELGEDYKLLGTVQVPHGSSVRCMYRGNSGGILDLITGVKV